MRRLRPKRAGSAAGIELTPEEGFVLARVDGMLSVSDLAAMTGIEKEKVETIVHKLASAGAVMLEEVESSGDLPDVPSEPMMAVDGETSMAELAAALGMDPSVFAAAEARANPVKERPAPAQRAPEPEPAMEREELGPASATEETLEREDLGPAGGSEERSELEKLEPAEATDATDADGEGAEGEDAEREGAQRSEREHEAASAVEVNQRNYHKLYETKFRPLPTDARVAAAQTATGADLLALCFDPDPRVVAAIMESPHVGLDHVRLLAFHHRTATGLEMISRRGDFTRDLLVERRLLRNPQCGDPTLNRIMSTKGLHQTYRIAIDRDVPDLTRAKSPGHLRKKWQTAASEERAELVMRTEARCLQLMTGCTFDARATAILCGKQFNSVLFVQNLAKFSATPPALLAHLFKQPFVRKIQPLKKMLLQHPNMPGDVKRGP